jgi:23S rRNA U2552 (ribose-2'-O)-methylase RlmE/FtsJ
MNKSVLVQCDANLKKGGSLLMKIFAGVGEKIIFDKLNIMFKSTKRIKPKSSRP